MTGPGWQTPRQDRAPAAVPSRGLSRSRDHREARDAAVLDRAVKTDPLVLDADDRAEAMIGASRERFPAEPATAGAVRSAVGRGGGTGRVRVKHERRVIVRGQRHRDAPGPLGR